MTRRPANSYTARDARDANRLEEIRAHLRTAALIAVRLEGSAHAAGAVLRYLLDAAEEKATAMRDSAEANVKIDDEARELRRAALDHRGRP